MERDEKLTTLVASWFTGPLVLSGAEPDDDDNGGGGGDGGSGGAGGNTGGTGGQNDDGNDDGLTDKGRQAIERERQSAQRARDKYKPWGAIAREFNLTPEQVRERLAGGSGTGGNSGGSGDGDQVSKADIEAARREAAAEATTKANRRIVKAEVKALAADTFADPSDAAVFLDLDDIEVDENGDVDTDAIKRALKDVLKAKPHLAKKGVKTSGSPDGGARETPPKAKGMSDLIRAARR